MGDEIVNNQFNSGIDGWDPWNTVNSAGQLAYTAGGQYSGAGKLFATVPGTTYRIRFNLTKPAGSLIEAEVYALPVVPPFIVNVVANNGTNTFYFTATTTQSWLRIQRADNNPGSITYYIDNVIIDQPTNYLADILMHTDYYPGGQEMPARKWVASNYRYSHNAQEKDNEIFQGATGAKYWEYDSRIIRRWNLDPKYTAKESRYVVNGNNPIIFTDPNGDFKTKFGAWLYNKTHGGKGEIRKDTKSGEWFVGSGGTAPVTGNETEVTVVYTRKFDWQGSNSAYSGSGWGHGLRSFWVLHLRLIMT